MTNDLKKSKPIPYQQFVEILQELHPEPLMPEVRNLLFKAFMGGYIGCFSRVMQLTDLPDEQAAEGLSRIDDELKVYSIALAVDVFVGNRKPPPKADN